jgi:hypothetical protein
LPFLDDGLGDPVVVVGGAHLVGVAVLEGPADAVDEDRGVVLEDRGLALLAGLVGEAVEDLLGVEEGELLGQVGPLGVVRAGGNSSTCPSAPLSTFQIFLTTPVRKSRLRSSG